MTFKLPKLNNKKKYVIFLTVIVFGALIISFIYKKYFLSDVGLFPVNTSGNIILQIKGPTSTVVGQEYLYQVVVKQAPSGFRTKLITASVVIPKSGFDFVTGSEAFSSSIPTSNSFNNKIVNDNTNNVKIDFFVGPKDPFALSANFVIGTFKVKPKSSGGTLSFDVQDSVIVDSSEVNQLRSAENLAVSIQPPTPTPTPAPNRIPVIDSITLSSNNNYVDPTNVTITVSASDPDGTVSSVEFFNGSTKLFTDNSAPFRFTWNNRSVGNSTITVKAKDNDGAYSALSSKTFTVKAAPTPTPSPTPAPNQLPTVTLNTSQSSSTAPSNITLTATASDPDGSVTLVEFYNGSTKIGQATSNNNNNTFTYTWSNRPQGTYNLKARAKDNTGAFGNYSAIKTVTVLAAPTPTPLPSPSPSPTLVAPTATPTPDSPTPTPTPLPANKFDVTGDGVVDMSDIINVIRRLFGV